MEETPTLTMQDLANVLQVVDEALKRSAFEPNELYGVSSVRERVSRFLLHIQEVQKAQEAAEAEKKEEVKADDSAD